MFLYCKHSNIQVVIQSLERKDDSIGRDKEQELAALSERKIPMFSVTE